MDTKLNKKKRFSMNKKLTSVLVFFIVGFSQITCAEKSTLIMPIVVQDEGPVAHNLFFCLKSWEFINQARNKTQCKKTNANYQQSQCTTAKSLIQGLNRESEIIFSAGKNVFTLNKKSIQRTIDVDSPHTISKEEMKDIYKSYGELTVELGNFLDPDPRPESESEVSSSNLYCKNLNIKELDQLQIGLEKCRSIKEINSDQSNIKNIDRAVNKITNCRDNLNSTNPIPNPNPPTNQTPK